MNLFLSSLNRLLCLIGESANHARDVDGWAARILVYAVLIFGWYSSPASADGPADNRSDIVRPIPPIGIEVPRVKREALKDRCREIRQRFAEMDSAFFASDVLVFPRAVEMTLRMNQVYQPADLKRAAELLDEAERRIDVIAAGGDWWAVMGIVGSKDSPRAVVGGHQSNLDDSFQPYGLIVPAGFDPKADHRDGAPSHRLDVWLHGRDERVSEVGFLDRSRKNLGQYQPTDTFVLHPFGRYSNAFKFAGEVDVFEAMDHISEFVPVDSNQVAIRGFSMGGAGCWQMATRHSDRWFAANPGAGFSETPQFLNFFQGEDLSAIPEYQRRLWQWYDSPQWVENLKHCPTIVYSGEIDRQKQAADAMQHAFDSAAMKMNHVIGPDTAHKIHPESKKVIESKMANLRSSQSLESPREVHLTTFTLRYNQMHWVKITALQQHWEKATVDAAFADDALLKVTTSNVTELNLNLNHPWVVESKAKMVSIQIDGQVLSADPALPCVLANIKGDWMVGALGDAEPDTVLRKRHGIQGPIDDAFMGRFLFVLPSGEASDPAVQKWIESESIHAMQHWQKHFRGDIRWVFDHEVDDEMIANNHLVVFGTPESNAWLGKVADRVPLIRDEPIAGHVPVLVYPNPANPDRYIVVNSGFTFREYDYLNNARQTPKLPDWAFIDIREGATTRAPGRVIKAGFFDERWQVSAE